MGEEAVEVKRPTGFGIFQPVTDCKDHSHGRLDDKSKHDRPAHPANEVLPKMREPFHGLQSRRIVTFRTPTSEISAWILSPGLSHPPPCSRADPEGDPVKRRSPRSRVINSLIILTFSSTF